MFGRVRDKAGGAGGLAALGTPEAFAHEQRELVIRRLADDLLTGADASTRVGAGIEYAESRPYVPGDSLRRLDWRLTARRQRPYSRQFEALRRVGVFIVVDTSGSMAAQSGATSKLDVALWLAAGLGLVALRRLSPVALLGTGERDGWQPPSVRRNDLWLGLERLLAARSNANGRNAAGGLNGALQRVMVRAEATALVVVLSDFQEPGSVESLGRIGARADMMALHLIDPAEREAPEGFWDAAEAETGRAFLGRRGVRWDEPERVGRRLVAQQIDTVALPLDASLTVRLRGFLAARGGLTRRAR